MEGKGQGAWQAKNLFIRWVRHRGGGRVKLKSYKKAEPTNAQVKGVWWGSQIGAENRWGRGSGYTE